MTTTNCPACNAIRRHEGPCPVCSGITLSNRRPLAGPKLSIAACPRCGGHRMAADGTCWICDAGAKPIVSPPPLPPRGLGRRIAAAATRISRAAFDKLPALTRNAFIRAGGKLTH